MRILTIWTTILIFGKSQALYPPSLERLWTKIDVAGAIERFVNGVNEYYEVNGTWKLNSNTQFNIRREEWSPC